ncbi:MAG: hypothetical protein JWL88_519 [Parcubacteria group bacterium]|nr:hypothetical protein [Parcubacteria group bacterium]
MKYVPQTILISIATLAFALPAFAASTTPAQAGLIDPSTGYTYAGAVPLVPIHHVAKKKITATHTAKKMSVKKTAVKKAKKAAASKKKSTSVTAP